MMIKEPEVTDFSLIEYMVDQNNGVKFKPLEKAFYKIAWSKTDEACVASFSFYIDCYFFKIIQYHEELLFYYKLQTEWYQENLEMTFSRIKKESAITSGKAELLKLFLNKYLEDWTTNKEIEIVYDIVYIDQEGIIKTQFPEDILIQNTETILKELNKAYSITTNPEAFIIALCYNLLVNLAYYFRKRQKEFPFLIFDGKSKGGKTSLLSLFVILGMLQQEDEGKVISNDVKSIFTFSIALSKGFKPLIIDDVNPKFFEDYSEHLKGAAGSTRIGRRGRPNLEVRDFNYTRSPEFTCNQQIKLELANSFRSIIVSFTEDHHNKQNNKAWFDLQFEPGFMYKLFDELFNNTKLELYFKTLENSTKSEEINELLLNIAFKKLEQLYEVYNVPFIFQSFSLKQNEDDDTERTFIEDIQDQWLYIKEAENSINGSKTIIDSAGNPVDITIKSKYFFRPLLSLQQLDIKENKTKIKIYLSAVGFKTWIDKHKHPYWRTIVDYINDSRLDPKPIIKTHRFSNSHPVRSLYLELTKIHEDSTNESENWITKQSQKKKKKMG